MKIILIICLTVLGIGANAQFGKKILNKAKQKAEQKADQKADEAINKGVEKVDSVITGKKRDKTSKPTAEKESVETTSEDPQPLSDNPANGTIETSYKEVIIKTNIRCETGKKKLETILRDTGGVSSIMIDNDNGNVYLSSENPDVRIKVIDIIRQHGFEADDKKPTKSLPNPCN